MAVNDQHGRDDSLRAVFADLEFPAPLWLLVAQAHAWGAGTAVLNELKRLPDGTYGSLAEVLRELGYSSPASTRAGDPERGTSPAQATGGTAATAVPLNRTAQHKIVGEGLAVGLLALGVEAVTINGPVVEAAFRNAWRSWAQRDRFPLVHVDAGRSDILSILQSSGRRKGVRVAEWSCAGEYRPLLRIASSVEWAGRRAGGPAGVTHGQWLALATVFAGRLDRDLGEIRYQGKTG
jgi:hypothetical protein